MKILLVDDEILWLKSLQQHIKKEQSDCEIFLATGGYEAIEILDREHIDFCTIDLIMERGSGMQVVKHIIKKHIPTQFCVLSAVDDKNPVMLFLKIIKAKILDKCDSDIIGKVNQFVAGRRQHDRREQCTQCATA